MRKILAVVCIAAGFAFMCAALGAVPNIRAVFPYTLAALFYMAAARHWVRTW